jgi:crotonobetainyl-CoA:carnitine CoA-transferase CaiB-like acyl-CoA transferase
VGKPHGNSHPMIAPYDLFETADRPVYIPSGNDGQWRRLAEVIGRPELADDPRFRTNPDRVKHRPEILEILNAEFRKWPADELCRRLWDATVPAGPVNAMNEVFADPQVVAREIVKEIPHPALATGVFRSVGPPARLHGTPAAIRRPPPRLGEHTVEVLGELGYSDGEIDRLVAGSVAIAM